MYIILQIIQVLLSIYLFYSILTYPSSVYTHTYYVNSCSSWAYSPEKKQREREDYYVSSQHESLLKYLYDKLRTRLFVFIFNSN